MIRRKRRIEEEHENHERWLVSYADFITLLFAFFVVMYSISSVNEGKYKTLSATLGVAFRGNDGASGKPVPLNPDAAIIRPITAPQGLPMSSEGRRLTRIASDLRKILGPLIKDGQIRVTQSSLGVSVEINASVLYLPGEAVLSDHSRIVLTMLARALRNDDHRIQIEGHTDSIPISTIKFASNWDLSAVRASSVARLFVDEGIFGGRVTVIGHADNKPVVDNATEDGRMRNRRVTVMILPNKEVDSTELKLPD